MREYAFSLTRFLLCKDRFCPNTGEYGSVKTRILAYFMQCQSHFQRIQSKLKYRSIICEIDFLRFI